MPTTSPLRYAAGPRALAKLRADGLRLSAVAAVVGPASGPKWLVLAGIDRALIGLGIANARPQRPRLLVGASAGAWRMLAMASPTPETTHAGLVEGYIGQTFGRADTPTTISEAYRRMLADLWPTNAIEHIVDRAPVDVAVHTVRLRVSGRSRRSKLGQMARLGVGAAFGRVTPRGLYTTCERVLFHRRPEAFEAPFIGRLTKIDRQNLLPAAQATGTVPVVMQPVLDIPGAPVGTYVDGGVADYQLNQRYLAPDDTGIVLMPHYQRRILPTWFDKSTRRRPAPDQLANLLHIYPSREWVAERLVDGQIPDRQDFETFVDAPDERQRRWRQAVSASNELGEQLLRDLSGKDFASRVESL